MQNRNKNSPGILHINSISNPQQTPANSSISSSRPASCPRTVFAIEPRRGDAEEDCGRSHQARSKGKVLDQYSRNGVGYGHHATLKQILRRISSSICFLQSTQALPGTSLAIRRKSRWFTRWMIRYRDKTALLFLNHLNSKPTCRYSCRH